MNTLSVRLRYRPLRLGWCVSSDDFEGFRRAARTNFTLWGGCYNPIIPADDPELAEALVRLFRVDILVRASSADSITAFIDRHKHLPWPFFTSELFTEKLSGGRGPLIVDISHPIAKIYNEFYKNNPNPESGLDIYEWENSDPLADALLCSYGALPAAEDVGVDYHGLASLSLFGQRNIIVNGAEIQVPTRGRDCVASLSAAFLKRHYVVQNHWDNPGFYVGDADNFCDLINFWNLRAAGVGLMFFDPRYAERLRAKLSLLSNQIRSAPTGRFGPPRPAIWHRVERSVDKELPLFGEGLTVCRVDTTLWNGSNIRAPVMYFDENSSLASISEGTGGTTISFPLSGKPFSEIRGNQDQHYVLSFDPGIGLYQNERATLHTPFIPKLNEFYGRNVHYSWNEARAEPESFGIITSISTDSLSLRALDVTKLIAEIFGTVGIEASPSKAGLVATTLMRQMGGLNGCRPFSIAGVRSLIENHNPDQSFDRGCAYHTILGKNTPNPLSNYQHLYIEPRKVGSELTASAVLSYLLEKGVFRAGLNFCCTNCQLEFWRTLDDTKSRLECEYCGHSFNTTPQLKDKAWAFRRSGLFGRNDHQQGAIPVLLTLQQLTRTHQMNDVMFATAMTLKSKGAAIQECEADFVILSQQNIDHKIEVVIGECKTRKPITADDVRKLTAVADAFPSDQYSVYIVLSRLTPFTAAEIEIIKPVNREYQSRVIMLTERELEPNFIYERTANEFDVQLTAAGFSDMAIATTRIFFQNLKHPSSDAGTE